MKYDELCKYKHPSRQNTCNSPEIFSLSWEFKFKTPGLGSNLLYDLKITWKCFPVIFLTLTVAPQLLMNWLFLSKISADSEGTFNFIGTRIDRFQLIRPREQDSFICLKHNKIATKKLNFYSSRLIDILDGYFHRNDEVGHILCIDWCGM